MQANQASLLVFLRTAQQFVIPIYQRNYSWKKEQCHQLWTDLLRAGQDEKVVSHFISSIVYIQAQHGGVMNQAPLLVIDGQQRLTTSTLFIAALAKHFETNNTGLVLETFSAETLRNYYLINPFEQGERRFKLLLSDADKATLLAILQDTPMPANSSSRITENYELFQQLILEHQDKLESICKGLAKLVIVDVSLDRTQDNPQLIFESLNSTGLELSQADQIRNYILMGLPQDLQTELYTAYWRPMEIAFGQGAYVVHFDAFMRHYLTAKTGVIPNVREVYAAFKTFAGNLIGDTRDLVADIHAYATYYCALALDTEQDAALKQAFHDLRELKVDVAYPFLLDVYSDYKAQLLTSNEALQIVRLVESYVFRRAICAIPTNSLNKTFAGMSRTLKKNSYLESVKATFLLLPSYRRFPGDEEFQRELKGRDLYNFRSRSYWLRRLENHGRNELVLVGNYTIEHILPQNEALSSAWQHELGPEWKRIQETWLHTLGNLTLTGYNSQYSDHAFAYKRDQVIDINGNQVGFAHSPLRLNQGLGQVEFWNEESIKVRAGRLACGAVKVWYAPQLAADVLNSYRPANAKPGQVYGLGDHPHLVNGAMSELFKTLSQSILALDACVNEEFLKIYVAYKSETNFVDVVPQAKRLVLVLNLPFDEIEDPKGLCRDITNIGSWGSGDVEIGISTMEELPYAMGLIRQSFDRQMEAGEI
jgi:uncharacterized protein with ParB-like and HNH nuclease domain/predicted transport protein